MRRIKTMVWQVTVMAVVVTAVCGCQRVALDCDYTIVPYVQMFSGGPGNTPSDLTAYAYYGTDEDFRVPSTFDSVVMGEVWSLKKNEPVLCNVQEMQNADGNIVLPLHATDALIVVCAPAYEIFAWKYATITENLWELRIPMWLRLWRGSNYKESWQFVFPPKAELSE